MLKRSHMIVMILFFALSMSAIADTGPHVLMVIHVSDSETVGFLIELLMARGRCVAPVRAVKTQRQNVGDAVGKEPLPVDVFIVALALNVDAGMDIIGVSAQQLRVGPGGGQSGPIPREVEKHLL